MEDINEIDKICDLSLKVPDTQKGYFDEMVIVDSTTEIIKFSFSKNLDDMEIAIYARTKHSVDLKNATWKLDDGRIPVKVKHLMNTHGVDFCMLEFNKDQDNFIFVHMHSGNKWFVAGFILFETYYYDFQKYKVMQNTVKWLNKIKDSENKDANDEEEENE